MILLDNNDRRNNTPEINQQRTTDETTETEDVPLLQMEAGFVRRNGAWGRLFQMSQYDTRRHSHGDNFRLQNNPMPPKPASREDRVTILGPQTRTTYRNIKWNNLPGNKMGDLSQNGLSQNGLSLEPDLNQSEMVPNLGFLPLRFCICI